MTRKQRPGWPARALAWLGAFFPGAWRETDFRVVLMLFIGLAVLRVICSGPHQAARYLADPDDESALIPLGAPSTSPPFRSIDELVESADMSFRMKDYSDAAMLYTRALGRIESVRSFESSLSCNDKDLLDLLRSWAEVVKVKRELSAIGVQVTLLVDREDRSGGSAIMTGEDLGEENGRTAND